MCWLLERGSGIRPETPPAAVLLLLWEGVPAAGSVAVWLGGVAWNGAHLYPACAWGTCCHTASCSPPSSCRPRSGNCPVGKILLTLLSCGRSAGMWGQAISVTLPLFPSLRPHWKTSPLQTEVMFSGALFSGCRVQVSSWRQQKQSYVRAAGRDVLSSASSKMLLAPCKGLARCGTALLPCSAPLSFCAKGSQVDSDLMRFCFT